MNRTHRARLLAVPLALSLLLPPAAQALDLDQARMLLGTYYIDPIPEEILYLPTLEEILGALGDPYTYYFTPEEYRQFTGSMSDQALVGIGVAYRLTAEGLSLQRVYADTPAEEAGLMAGDVIVAVEGRRPGAGESPELLSSWLQGETGTQVALTYLRGGTEYTLTVQRRAIVLPATVSELWDGHIGYIDCDTFGGETLAHFTQAIDAYGAQADVWVVDLRGNGGGEVNAAIQSTACFTGAGVLAWLRDSGGRYQGYGAEEAARTDSPVILLTASETASASELFAAGVRDTGAGLIIGERTFGKGVGQNVFDQTSYPLLFAEGDAIKITAFRFFSPGGSTTDTIGVIPHLLVAPGHAAAVARLLSSPAPEGDNRGMLRIDFGRSWYVDLEQALSEDYRAAFRALLEALPSAVRVFQGSGADWNTISPADLAARCGLEAYQRRGFSDTAQSRFAAQIDALAAYGVVQGSGDGFFRPFDTLTRAQLCALLAQALHCDVPSGESHFSDVAMDAWYGPAVNALAEMSLVNGVGGGLFRPDDLVTHEQFIAIMGRLGRRLNMYLDSSARQVPDTLALYEALAPYADWSREGAWLLAMSQTDASGKTGTLLWDSLYAIAPGEATTRDEAAYLTCSLLSYIGVLPV